MQNRFVGGREKAEGRAGSLEGGADLRGARDSNPWRRVEAYGQQQKEAPQRVEHCLHTPTRCNTIVH